jgi:hypothetical protein
MKVYEHADPGSLRPRTHPWTERASDAAHRYYDFRRQPELIRSVLEDFVGHDAYPAVETFYRLLEWLSSDDCAFESNDCAFSAPAIDPARETKRVACSGRLMILFRELAENTSPEQLRWLTHAVARGAQELDPELEWGALGLTITSVVFTTLPGPASRQRGQELMLSFWAWGDDEAEAMAHLDRTLAALTTVLRGISDEIRQAPG